MSQISTPFQELLLNAYTEEADRYSRALQVAEALPDSLRENGRGEAELQQITALIDDVKRIEVRIADAKHAWQASGQQPEPRLKRVLHHVAELIEGLSGRIRNAES